MEKYMNKGIKEVIGEFPEIGSLLESYGIGCTTCTVGTCLLKDVIQVHGLPKEQEARAMAQIQRIVYPGREITVLEIPLTEQTVPSRRLKYSPPVKRLVEEHDRIKRLLALIPSVSEHIRIHTLDRKLIEDITYFIRYYADRFHHAKEEDILFKYTDESQDIIKVMYEDHKTGRSHVMRALDALEQGDGETVAESLEAYRELLLQHIKKEDEILYPWIDRTLSTHQVGELVQRFSEVDKRLGMSITEEFEAFLKASEIRFMNKEEK